MCGRFVQYFDDKLDPVFNKFGILTGFKPTVSINIAPGMDPLIILKTNSGLVMKNMKWGFKPSWANHEAPTPINAKVENLTHSYFKESFIKSRIIVPVTGFYEWQKDDYGNKRPKFIRRATKELLFFPGFYDINPDTAEPGFTVLTQRPNDMMADIHHRQPVMFDEPKAKTWLTSKPEVAQQLARQISKITLNIFDVSPAINSPANNDIKLIEKFL